MQHLHIHAPTHARTHASMRRQDDHASRYTTARTLRKFNKKNVAMYLQTLLVINCGTRIARPMAAVDDGDKGQGQGKEQVKGKGQGQLGRKGTPNHRKTGQGGRSGRALRHQDLDCWQRGGRHVRQPKQMASCATQYKQSSLAHKQAAAAAQQQAPVPALHLASLCLHPAKQHDRLPAA